jgi:sugar phosphate isomerase/epimerase
VGYNTGKKRERIKMMETGVVTGYGKSLAEDFAWCAANGIPTCQLGVGPGQQTKETADEINELCKRHGMRISALIGCWSGPQEWNAKYGPATLGIVPTAYRAMRMKELEANARFACMLNVPDIATHLGFIPENPGDPLYNEVEAAIRHLTNAYKNLGINLNMETGQETPFTLLRVIQDVQSANLGINFDPANLLMYGRANPIDALDIIGKYVKGVHAKDGEYPTDGYNLGKEKPLGQGMVDIPRFINKLKEVGYQGPVTIEREIHGEQQKKDILAANKMLKELL